MSSRTRGYLPHSDDPQQTYFLTFRLDDSLPTELIRQWSIELAIAKNRERLTDKQLNIVERKFQRKIENHLDKGLGNCWLQNPEIAAIVANAFRYFDQQRYFLHAWTIMPNHVHVLFTLAPEVKLSSVIHTWKSFTAHQANKLLQRTGRFWQPEYFETTIKSPRHFEFCIRYILNNPVKAGLCKEPHNWFWTSVAPDYHYLAHRFFWVERK